jgi:hypothetical protein
LSNFISSKKFGFLEGRIIKEAIRITREGIHSINNSKDPAIVVKLDFSKVYDRVS